MKPLTTDILTRDPDLFAAVAPSSELFGVLTHSFDLPPLWAALATATDGSMQVHTAGSSVTSDDVEELMVVSTAPVSLTVETGDLISADGHACAATVTVDVQANPDADELRAVRRQLVGGRRRVTKSGIYLALEPAILQALRAHAAKRPAAELLSPSDAHLTANVESQLQPVLFKLGLTFGGFGSGGFDSADYRQATRQHKRQQHRRQAHEVRAQLREAVHQAQQDHVAHLEGLLGRLQTLAADAPETEFGALIRTFDATQRGQIYEALGASHVPEARSAWIAIACGHEVLLIDPGDLGSCARRLDLSGPAGALRSLSHTRHDGTDLLLAGTATGVVVADLEQDHVRGAHLADADADQPPRGGFNAVALGANRLFATHSELGLVRWTLEGGDPRTSSNTPASAVLRDRCDGARAVRHAQVHGDTLWLSIDDVIVAVELDRDADDNAPYREYRGSGSTVTALAICDDAVLAGLHDGRILSWSIDALDAPTVLHSGQPRAVESVVPMVLGGIQRLFFTNTSTAVVAEVLGDRFSCRYGAGGQTLRRAEVAADWVVATNETRDRLLCWPIHDPTAIPAVLPVAQWTGRTVQDVCLIPQCD